jgi:hypothetical protein
VVGKIGVPARQDAGDAVSAVPVKGHVEHVGVA